MIFYSCALTLGSKLRIRTKRKVLNRLYNQRTKVFSLERVNGSSVSLVDSSY